MRSRTLQASSGDEVSSSQDLVIYAQEIDKFAKEHPKTAFIHVHQGGYPYSHIEACKPEDLEFPQKNIYFPPGAHKQVIVNKLETLKKEIQNAREYCKQFLSGSLHVSQFDSNLRQTLAYKNILSDADPLLRRLLTRKYCERHHLPFGEYIPGAEDEIKLKTVKYIERILQEHERLITRKTYAL